MEHTIKSNRSQLAVRGIKFCHFALSLALFYIFWLLFRYHTLRPHHDIGYRYNYFVLMGYGAILFFFIRTYNAYLVGYSRIRSLVAAQTLSDFSSFIL